MYFNRIVIVQFLWSLLRCSCIFVCFGFISAIGYEYEHILVKEPKTFVEAQHHCYEEAGYITRPLPEYHDAIPRNLHTFWSGLYNVKSSWIAYSGCHNNVTADIAMYFIDNGPERCQIHCHCYQYFALSNNTCYCLKNNSYIGMPAEYSKCNIRCQNSTLHTCGGESSVASIYRSVVFQQDQSTLDKNCITLKCSNKTTLHTMQLTARDCTSLKQLNCSSNITQNKTLPEKDCVQNLTKKFLADIFGIQDNPCLLDWDLGNETQINVFRNNVKILGSFDSDYIEQKVISAYITNYTLDREIVLREDEEVFNKSARYPFICEKPSRYIHRRCSSDIRPPLILDVSWGDRPFDESNVSLTVTTPNAISTNNHVTITQDNDLDDSSVSDNVTACTDASFTNKSFLEESYITSTTGLIIGIAVGGVVLAGIIITVGLLCRRKHMKRHSSSEESSVQNQTSVPQITDSNSEQKYISYDDIEIQYMNSSRKFKTNISFSNQCSYALPLEDESGGSDQSVNEYTKQNDEHGHDNQVYQNLDKQIFYDADQPSSGQSKYDTTSSTTCEFIYKDTGNIYNHIHPKDMDNHYDHFDRDTVVQLDGDFYDHIKNVVEEENYDTFQTVEMHSNEMYDKTFC